jgi:N-glycosylase/DNA lyase
MSEYIVDGARIESAVTKVCNLIESEPRETRKWADLSERELWLELVSCILGSRVRYETATECSRHLGETGVLEKEKLLENPKKMAAMIQKELHKPLFPPFSNNRACRYPFPKTKAKCIVTTATRIYQDDGTTIKDILNNNPNPFEARDALVTKCSGIGLKQASLFLRNVSFSDNLAILDTHVMTFIELLITGKPVRMTPQKYLFLEKMLHNYATSRRISLDKLDMAIWIVMRIVKKEFSA